MKSSKKDPAVDHTTEEKIKNAAQLIFHQKGFSATRTRDIAEASGINLALLNYYFRSKEKLFDIIMLETFQKFVQSLTKVINDENASLDTKIELIVSNYIDLLTEEPNIPIFIMTELKNNPGELLSKVGMREVIITSHLMKQVQQGIREGNINLPHPLHFIMNMMGMTVFPFIASPMIMGIGNLQQQEFDALMEQRKILIPKWIKATLKTK